MLFSICIFSAFSLGYDIINDGTAVLLKPFALRYLTLIFNLLCTCIALLYAEKHKYLYAVGATLGIIATESFLLNKAVNALVTSQNICEILISGLSFAAILLLIVTIIVLARKLSEQKPLNGWLNLFAIIYMAIIFCIALLNCYEKVFLDFDSVYAAVMMTTQYILLINAPLVVFVLVRQAREDNYLQ